jgi:hypothetical protein
MGATTHLPFNVRKSLRTPVMEVLNVRQPLTALLDPLTQPKFVNALPLPDHSRD